MDASQAGSGRIGGIFRSFRYRNYRLFFFGQIISLTGNWMQLMALSWLIYRLYENEFLLGAINFAAQFPTFVLAPLAGVMADRWNRRKAMVVTQTLMMMEAFALTGLAFAGLVSVGRLVLLAVYWGVVNAFDIPTRQAFVAQMIEDRRDLPNAIALNSSIVNGARLIGPLLAGLIVAFWSEAGCFLVNGLSYLAVIAALLAMRPVPQAPRAGHSRVLHDMGESFRYAWHYLPVRMPLLLLAAMSLVAVPFMVLLPVFAKHEEILGGNATTLALLMSAAGVGAMGGAGFLASRRTIVGLVEMVTGATLVFGAGLIGFSFSRTLWLSLALMVVAGLAMMIVIAAVNTLLQTVVDEDKRGRVMSLWAISFMGMAPFGSLLAGVMAKWIGAPRTVLASGVASLAAGGLFALGLPAFRRAVQPAYERLGLVQPIRGFQVVATPLGGLKPAGGDPLIPTDSNEPKPQQAKP